MFSFLKTFQERVFSVVPVKYCLRPHNKLIQDFCAVPTRYMKLTTIFLERPRRCCNIFKLQKQSFLRAVKILKFRFWAVFCSIFTKIEPESALRLGFRQTFFSRILQSLAASEKNSVDFTKNFFHVYFGCDSAIAGDRDFEVKTAFWRDLRANYRNVSE